MENLKKDFNALKRKYKKKSDISSPLGLTDIFLNFLKGNISHSATFSPSVLLNARTHQCYFFKLKNVFVQKRMIIDKKH